MRSILILSCLILLFAVAADSAEPVSFRSDIAPVLLDHCLACHDSKSAEGGYRVDSYDELLKPGESGELPVARKEAETSELLRRLDCEDESERMPAETEPLSAKQIQLVKTWIDEGAKFDGETSSQSLAFVIPATRYADPPESYDQPIAITAVCFTPDGSHLIVGGYHELTIWDVSTGTLFRRMKNVGQRTFSIAMDHDGKTLAVGCGEPGQSGEVRLIDFSSGLVTHVIARSNDVVLDVTFRPGSDEIAVASADGLIQIVNTKTLVVIRTLASHAGAVNSVAWSDDGSLLVSASADKSAKVFEGDSGQLLTSYKGHGAAVRGVSILADGKQVVSTGADKKLHRWNIEGAKGVATVGIGGTGFKAVRANDFIIVPCADHQVRRIDLADNKVSQELQGHTDWVLSAAIDTTISRIASGAFNGEVRIWNVADGSLVNAWIAKP